jgi:hypothetical protein
MHDPGNAVGALSSTKLVCAPRSGPAAAMGAPAARKRRGRPRKSTIPAPPLPASTLGAGGAVTGGGGGAFGADFEEIANDPLASQLGLVDAARGGRRGRGRPRRKGSSKRAAVRAQPSPAC